MSRKKTIELFTDQGFEEGAIELLKRYSPGPVYIIPTDTPEGEGVFLCDEPFTLEEAEAQFSYVPKDLSDEEEEDESDVDFEQLLGAAVDESAPSDIDN